MSTGRIQTDKDEAHRLATLKAMQRLLPLMCAIYFLSFIDRTNVGMAKSALQSQLGIGPEAYGFGAGVFFWGYALLEVPSNLMTFRVGPRQWIARIAVTWGALSAAMMFVQGEWSFITLRVLLGIAEAGLFPALMYVTTLWFAQKDRSVAVGWIYTAPSMGLIVGSILGGALLQLDGLLGLAGWQWLFLLEGLPTVVLGLILFFVFPDRPKAASWLTPAEADVLESYAAGGASPHTVKGAWLIALKQPTTLLMGLVYFFNQVGFVGLYFFAPAMVGQMHASSPFVVGLLSSSVGFGFLFGILILPRIHRHVSNDFVFLAILTAGFAISAAVFMVIPTPAVRIALFVITAFFGGGILPIYWAVSMKRLHGVQAASGLAMINTIGLLGGFAGPYIFGLVEKSTGTSLSAFAVILVTALIGLALIPLLARAFNANAHEFAGAREGFQEPA
jgi:MFS family permease